MAIGTGLGYAERDRIIVRGHDLVNELLGNVSFAGMTSLMLRGDLPTPEETRMIDAMLVVLIEHGLVKPALVARMIYSNAPESTQAAVAAALLGAGTRHLGSSEHCAQMLAGKCARGAAAEEIEAAAAAIVADHRTRRVRIPGIGHRTHPDGDPRARKLFAIAAETGVYSTYCTLLERVADAAGQAAGRALPVNVTGAIAGIAVDMGFRWEVGKAFALVGRTLGAFAQIQEEIDAPIADEVQRLVVSVAERRPGSMSEQRAHDGAEPR